MKDILTGILILLGVPLYLYMLCRWFTGAIVRSIYEVREEFALREKTINK